MRRVNLAVLAVFLAVEALLGSLLWLDYQATARQQLAGVQADLHTGLRSVLSSYGQLVEVGLHGITGDGDDFAERVAVAGAAGERERDRLRGEIYRALHPHYAVLREHGVPGLDIVLADGRTLLRMGRPDLYGDRAAVPEGVAARALREGRPVNAFEHGRVEPGFRYAFPLRHDGRVVGALVFTVSYETVRAVRNQARGETPVASRFLLRREPLAAASHPSVMGRYRVSALHQDYVVEEGSRGLGDEPGAPLPAWVEALEARLEQRPDIRAAMAEGRASTLHVCASGEGCHAVELLPILDGAGRAAAYVAAYVPAPGLLALRHHQLLLFAAMSLALALALLALGRWLRSRERLEAIGAHMGEGLYVMDRGGRITYVNRAAEQILGHGRETLLGARAHELFHHDEDGPAGHPCQIRARALEGEVYHSADELFVRADGTRVPVSVTSSPLRDRGRVAGAVVLFRDISAEQETHLRLKQADAAFRHMAEGVILTDRDSRIVAVNHAFTVITGYQEAEVVGRDPSLLSSGRQGADFYQSMWRQLVEHDHWEGELWNRRKSGELYPERMKLTAVRDEAGTLQGYVSVFSDVTDLRRKEERLQDLAYHDRLTGLYNRAAFMELFGHALSQAQRQDRTVAVLYLDVDRFKRVNDTLGHVVGDELLQQVAARIRGTVREQDLVARLGGDELVVLLEGYAGADVPGRVADKLVRALRAPMVVDHRSLYVTASIGISVYPRDGADITTLLKNADAAMYLAKQEGRDGSRYFAPSMAQEAVSRFELENELRRALERDELVPHYQPKVDLHSGRICGLEALLRWDHPELGLLTPDKFLGVVVEAGLMRPVTERVLRRVSRQCQQWKRQGCRDVRVSVNLDTDSLNDGELEPLLETVMREEGLSPHDLELEIVETAMLSLDRQSALLERLVARGFELSIDDFGTGESSLARLKALPFGTLKIDRSFVRDLERDESDRTIIRAIIAMAQTLGKQVLAEGVETAAQMEFLREAGCDAIQGYYVSRPVPAAEVMDLLDLPALKPAAPALPPAPARSATG